MQMSSLKGLMQNTCTTTSNSSRRYAVFTLFRRVAKIAKNNYC